MQEGMYRVPLRTFLIQAKRRLADSVANGTPLHLVIGNESADLDSITASVVYAYIRAVVPVTNIPAKDLSLRPELTALLKHANVEPEQLITLDDLSEKNRLNGTKWILVDHNALQESLGKAYGDRVIGCVDHHDDEGKTPSNAEPRIITKSGSCNSLVINYCRDAWVQLSSGLQSSDAAHGQDDGTMNNSAYTSTWDAQVAKLALGSILIDTVNMTDHNKVTHHDRMAVDFLQAKINASPTVSKDFNRDDFYNLIAKAKTNLDGLSLEDILRKDYKAWSDDKATVGISSVVKPIEYLQGKTDDLRAALTDFAEARKLDLFAIMTAYTSEKGDFERQLLLLAHSKDGTRAAEKFAAQVEEELQLENSDAKVLNLAPGSTSGFSTHLWKQNNTAASRKRVGPLLREALRPSL